ncbi:SPATA4 [Symbiodinium sp. CCMP2592]|nr:SPATA4 [Symbiodinium sp. CCMP2592]
MALACGLLLLYAGIFFTEGMRPVDMSALESEDLGACKKRKGSTPGSEIWCRCNHQGGPIVSQEACEDPNGDRKTKCQWDEDQLKCLPTAPATSTSEDIFSEIHEVSENLKNDDTNMSLRDLVTNTTSTSADLHWLHPWHAVNYVGSWVSPSSAATTTTTSEVPEVMQRELNFEPGKMKSLPQSSEESEDLTQRGSNSNKLCWSGFFRCWALCRALAEQIAQVGWRRGREREDDARHLRCCRSCILGCALRLFPRTSSEAFDVYTTTPTTKSLQLGSRTILSEFCVSRHEGEVSVHIGGFPSLQRQRPRRRFFARSAKCERGRRDASRNVRRLQS